ncbi:hypothetical protein [Psychrobacter sp. I-STPA10]|uniref:hypothetical protein n=1 Tax=Psychrobacter sp. I-STPA10 TaxID=2585769 RepID=UPI001E442514|nr:hypothetical protein [Psychrobacter sp. I-STPA10]
MSLKETLKQGKQLERLAEMQKQGKQDSKSNTDVPASRSLGAVKPRNYLALNPLLRKGGIHEKDDVKIVRKKRRRETKQKLRQTDWLSEL